MLSLISALGSMRGLIGGKTPWILPEARLTALENNLLQVWQNFNEFEPEARKLVAQQTERLNQEKQKKDGWLQSPCERA